MTRQARAAMVRLERTLGLVLRVGVTTSSICLAVGLVLSLVTGWDTTATLLLKTGTLVLLATPVARVVVSIVEYIGQRDWAFVGLTAIVLVELMASVAAALMFGRRL